MSMVRIRNAELNVESEVLPESVYIWEEKGWQVVEETSGTPAAASPGDEALNLDENSGSTGSQE